ncbi:MAG TPA: hypothetical protein VIL35_13915 [Vicinamibacterales bacterium]
MPQGRFASVAAAIVLASAVITAQQQPLWRISPRGMPDDRARVPDHLDHPANFEPGFASRAEWEARADRLRRQVKVALGLWPMPERAPLKPVFTGRIERDGYTVERVYFESLPGHIVTGNLYRPTGAAGKRPGVLSPHGHWEGGRLLEQPMDAAKAAVASGAEQTLEGARYPLQARCAMLARLGAVVFQFDMVGYAESQAIAHRTGFLDAEAELRLQSFMGLQIWNAIRALDFLASRPDVDPARLAVTGESGGGTQTFLLTAVDDRPVTAVPAVMVSGNMQGGCICENASLLRVGTNNIELAALFAPKPLAAIAADDWTYDMERRGLPELKRIYGLFSRTDAVDAKHFPFPHNYNQVSREYMYAWFNRHLGLGHAEPIREQPFTPVPPKELAVFQDGDARPQEADAAALRRTLTARADEQLRALAKDPARFVEVVRPALEVMIADRYRGGEARIDGGSRLVRGDGFFVYQQVLTRPGTRARVPTITIVPTGWSAGTVVVWTHPEGKAAAFEADGRTPSAAIRPLLDAGATVLVPDVFLTGEAGGPGERTKVPNEEKYAGYYYGYNRSILANRASDILTAVDFAHGLGASQVHLVAVGRAGVWALPARALAGRAVARAALSLDGFDFDQVKSVDDEMMLPGALRYGGIPGIAALCTEGQTLLTNAPTSGTISLPAAVRVSDADMDDSALASWVIGS